MQTTEKDILEVFEQYGKVSEVKIRQNRDRFAFVTFENQEDADEAFQKLIFNAKDEHGGDKGPERARGVRQAEPFGVQFALEFLEQQSETPAAAAVAQPQAVAQPEEEVAQQKKEVVQSEQVLL